MIDVSQWFPYSLTRTWHLQLAIFWIATAFLSVGLFLGPLVNGGKDPPYQKLGVNILFVALIVVVVGTLAGNFLAIKQVMPEYLNFWLGHQGYEYLWWGACRALFTTCISRAPWMEKVKWPLMCFVAVAFWNMVGAGIFGFMINTPIALFYLQGLNTTAVHAHAALFGVYGFLAIGFVLLVLRYIKPGFVFSDKLMGTGFWWLNAGLVLMILTSLLPVGLFQFEASVGVGMWYARSDTFLQQGFLETLRWIRTFGDVVFIVGAFSVAWQVVLGLLHSGDHDATVMAGAGTHARASARKEW